MATLGACGNREAGREQPLTRGPSLDAWLPGQTFDQSSETWRALCRVLTLCNRAAFKSGQDAVPVPKVRTERTPCYRSWQGQEGLVLIPVPVPTSAS